MHVSLPPRSVFSHRDSAFAIRQPGVALCSAMTAHSRECKIFKPLSKKQLYQRVNHCCGATFFLSPFTGHWKGWPYLYESRKFAHHINVLRSHIFAGAIHESEA
jgi:hypothetical protein